MKKKLLLLFTIFLLVSTSVFASSINIDANKSSVDKGGTITFTVTGSDVIGRVNVSSSNSSVLSLNTGSVWIENNSMTFNGTASSSGNATITITPSDISNSNGDEISLGSKSKTITVNADPVVVEPTPSEPPTQSSPPTTTESHSSFLKSLR